MPQCKKIQKPAGYQPWVVLVGIWPINWSITWPLDFGIGGYQSELDTQIADAQILQRPRRLHTVAGALSNRR